MTGSQGVLARGRGNPLHSIEADVSARMLHVVFPHLEKGSSDYKRKVDVMKTLRIRGRRYQALTRYFGEGILALLPWSGQLGQADIGLSENELSRLPDNLFSKLLDILKETQGRTLKSFSQEAWSIVSQMISCPVDQCPRFPLENVRSSEILEHPKNSPGLLRMLIGPDSLPLSGLPCAATQY
ncbi:hypothetical protein BDW42DRAFT_78036 [Aspergillus taichungensis]|uniref:Uncharacterized protein n=1 Tax=Aspergillus taichungensis TaxID=482145 RepID=A0A2J5HYT7_9EURO|nr:hypothetical protein BDW42DRAFT_78036 [Aspergillus taichungensis]